MHYDIGACEILYSEFREMAFKAWNENFNFLCIDMTKNKNEDKSRIFNESRNTYIESFCETEAF